MGLALINKLGSTIMIDSGSALFLFFCVWRFLILHKGWLSYLHHSIVWNGWMDGGRSGLVWFGLVLVCLLLVMSCHVMVRCGAVPYATGGFLCL